MPSRKRKKRQREERRPKQPDHFETIRRLLPPPAEIFRLREFLPRYAPLLKTRSHSCDDSQHFQEILISPLDTLKPALHLKAADCREPLHSIVEDVVWSLVQRRDRSKRIGGKDERNVLAQGFSSSPPSEYPSTRRTMHFPTTRYGLTQLQANENATFCKTSKLFLLLHSHVGDEIIRMLLLHTRLFIPWPVEIGGSSPETRGNCRLICGPLLSVPRPQTGSGSDNSKLYLEVGIENAGPRRIKKRRRQNPPVNQSLLPNRSISRFTLFYASFFTPKVDLPHRHPLRDPEMTPEKLLAILTDLFTSRGVKRRKRWRRLRSAGLGICRKIMKDEKSCDYHRLLEHYCPLPYHDDVHRFEASDDLDILKDVVQCYSPSENVSSFVKSVLSHVFPPEFWGSSHNFDCVLGAVHAFVSLRRKERLSNKRLMHGVRFTHITWLQSEKRNNVRLSRTDYLATSQLALHAFRWVFRGFIIPLLRSCFHVTETEFSLKKVQYYRKPVWSIFRTLSMRKLLQAQFRELSKQEVLRYLSSHRMGFSQLQLLPKRTGVRPIAQLSRPSNRDVDEILRASKKRKTGGTGISMTSSDHEALDSILISRESTNSILTHVFDVLTYECSRHEEPFGSGLRGFHEFYPRYQRYVAGLKRQLGKGQPLGLVFASIDIEKCYDNINQNYVYDIARRHFCHEDYVIKKLHYFYGDAISGAIRRRIKRVIGPPERQGLHQQNDDKRFLQSRTSIHLTHPYQMVQRSIICELLGEHLRNHLVVISGRFGQRFLVQTSGIAQGSILSMLLCNLYYGEIENFLLNKENPRSPHLPSYVFSKNPPEQDFLARQVDDFLFVSTSKPAVSDFLERTWSGRPELGVKINREKSLVSEKIAVDIDAQEGPKPLLVPVASSRAGVGKLFPWCGMLFDTRTGEVTVDYERFHGGVAKNSLSVDSIGSEGKRLAYQMQSYARPRCLPILYDCSINSRATIIMNFYQMMLYAGAKTAEHIRSAELQAALVRNDDRVLVCIDSLAAFAGRQIRRNLRNQKSDHQRSLILDDALLVWLTWHAFSAVFCRLQHFESFTQRIQMRLKASSATAWSDIEATIATAYHRFSLEKIIEI